MPLSTASPALSVKGFLALAILILSFTVFFGRQMSFRFENGLSRSTVDMASINQAIWNTSQGRPFQATILYEGFRNHLEPILAFYSLNYLLGGGLYSLFYLHSLLIALGAIPIYLMVIRRTRPPWEALCAAILYLTLPPLHDAVRDSYLRPDLIFFPVLSLMVYAVLTSNLRCLIVSVILALFCKETGAVTVAGLGLYYLSIKRQYKLGTALLVLGIAWIPMTLFVFLPWAMGNPTHHLARFRSLSLILSTALGLVELIWPPLLFAVALFLGWRRRSEVLISSFQAASLFLILPRLRYVIPLVPVVFSVAVDALANWEKGVARRILWCVLPIIFVVLNAELGVWKYPLDRSDIDAARPLIAMIPPQAAVVSDTLLLVHLSTREKLYAFNRHHYYSAPSGTTDYLSAEYFLVDNERILEATLRSLHFMRHSSYRSALTEIENLGLEELGASGPWRLFRRKNG